MSAPSTLLLLRIMILAASCWLSMLLPAQATQSPEEVVAGFDQRLDDMFRAESGKPLKRAKKNPPLKPGRGNYVRGYSYSMVGFAARCFYLGEMQDAANAAVV
jgi:hypothetical protein